MRSMRLCHFPWTVATIVASIIACGHDQGPVQSATPVLSLSPTGSLTVPRDLHTATLLNNGQVLVVGGGEAVRDGGGQSKWLSRLVASTNGEESQRLVAIDVPALIGHLPKTVELTKKADQALARSAGLAIRSPRGIGEPHDVAPRRSSHLSAFQYDPPLLRRKM